MDSEQSLPVILVSAVDASTADKFISELIGEEEVEAGCAAQQGCAVRVWQLHNKYYSARVALSALPDALPPPRALLPHLDAHLVLLASHETESGAWLERRVAALGAALGAARGARVRLALAQSSHARGGWAAAARARRYEPVPLRAPPTTPSDSEGEEAAGAARAREALHAHTWRSLRLHDAAPRPGSGDGSSDSGASSPEPEQEWSEWQSAELTRRADQFAAALGALAGGGGGGAGVGEDARELRLLRAEALLAALSGAPPPAPPPPPL